MKAITKLLMFLTLAILMQTQAMAALIFEETFDSDTVSTLQTLATYTDFSATASNVIVNSGVVEIASSGVLDLAGFSGDLNISAKLGAVAANPGSFNIGISIGSNTLIFHPGFAGGAFRVDGPGGFSNELMGFNPASDILHLIEISILEATGQFDITVTDGNNALNQYSATFTNSAYSSSDRIGFHGGSIGTGDIGLFDDLSISNVVSVSAPTPLIQQFPPK